MLVAGAARHQLHSAQPASECARRRQMDAWVQGTQACAQLTGSPGGMTAAKLAQRLLPAPRQLSWRMVRSAGMISQTGATLAAETMQPFVTRGTGDAEVMTKLDKRFALLERSQYELFTGRKQGACMPRHARSVRQTLTLDCPRCLGLALSTMSCHRASHPQQPGLPNERTKFPRF